MASAFRPTYLRPIPDGAKPCTFQGQPAVRYTDKRGKEHVRPVRKGRNGKRMIVCEQTNWWMRFVLPDKSEKRVKGFSDRTTTEQEADRREREAAAAAAGLIPVAETCLKMNVTEHLEDFINELERIGRARKHYALLQTRILRMVDGCQWTTLSTVTPDSLTPFLAKLKREGAAAKTVNEYINAITGLLNWCLKNRRLVANPLAFIARADQTEKTYRRRGLTTDEARRLLAVAGPRRLLYHMALRTGLRRSELKQLTWDDLRVGPDDPVPAIRLPAAITKARRADIIPLRQDLAQQLRDARPKDARPGLRVFAHIPKMATFKLDLLKAKIDHKDKAGRIADFHAMRLTLNTDLHRAGVPLRTTMEILRHTDPRLSTETYLDANLLNTSAAVELLPSLSSHPDENQDAKVLTKSTSTPVLFSPFPAQHGWTEQAAGEHMQDAPSNKKPCKAGPFVAPKHLSCNNSTDEDMVEAALRWPKRAKKATVSAKARITQRKVTDHRTYLKTEVRSDGSVRR